MHKTSRIKHSLMIRARVSVQRGSWKWQDAYRIASYRLQRLRNGKLALVSYAQSSKLSAPQVARSGVALHARSSLHFCSGPALRPYLDIYRAQLSDALGPNRAARYERLAARMVRGLEQQVYRPAIAA
jgi:hypothetical protein